MEIINKFFKKYIHFLVIGGIIVLFVPGRLYYKYNIYRVKKEGNRSVAYVYDDRPLGRTTASHAKFLFYLSKYKYKNESSTPKHYYPKNKFYIVYYMPDNPKNSVLDFNKEIYPDSVYKYFPVNQNPFEKEIREAKSKY